MNPTQGLGNDNSPYEHDVSAPNLTVNPTQDWREKLKERMLSLVVSITIVPQIESESVLGSSSPRAIASHENVAKELDLLNTFCESLIERGRLQGIEEAKGCVPERKPLQDHARTQNVVAYGEVVRQRIAWNECRDATLTALDKLKGE